MKRLKNKHVRKYIKYLNIYTKKATAMYKETTYLTCFSVKPKRYRDLEIWGYVKPGDENALMAYPIKNTDITEIHWNNRSAMPILQTIEEDKQISFFDEEKHRNA